MWYRTYWQPSLILKSKSTSDSFDLLSAAVVQITVDEQKLGVVLSDLAQRNSHIIAINNRQNTRIVTARAALAELRNYSSKLRKITSGLALFSMKLAHYEQMSKDHEQKTVHAITGLNRQQI